MAELREWQQICKDAFADAVNEGRDRFVFEACPGAGKSRMAAELSWFMLNDETLDVDLVVVIVPWKSIQGDEQSGMIQTCDLRGLVTRDRLMLKKGRLPKQPRPRELSVIVTTYAEAMCQEGVDTIELFRNDYGMRVAFIFDEIHHANEANGSWGEYAEQMESQSAMTVVMSGTYFRSDGRKIKFVGYNDNDKPILSTPAYTYTQGVSEQVVRPVGFRYIDAELDCVDSINGEETHNVSSIARGDRRMGAVMREVFHPEGEVVHKLIHEVDQHIRQTRAMYPNAGALFTCRPGRMDSSEDKHVHQIAQKVRQYTGQEVVVVTHADRNAAGKIDAFRNSTVPYLVAVNMVSEGVDIPRLRALCFMRYIDSEMMFRQMVGRILRMIKGEENGPMAMGFLPDFQWMRQMAVNMEQDALTGIRDLQCPQCGRFPCECPCRKCGKIPCECPPTDPPPRPQRPDFEVVGSTALDSGGSVSNDEIAEAFVTLAKAFKQRKMMQSHLPDVQVAHILQFGQSMSLDAVQPESSGPTHLEKLSGLRRRVNRLMQKLSGKCYEGNFGKCWSIELKPFSATWDEIKSGWSLSRIEMLANHLEQRLKDEVTRG